MDNPVKPPSISMINNRSDGRVVMALASGTPDDTLQCHQISASGAIRVGSSPTLIKKSFTFCMDVDHAQLATERGQSDMASE